MFLCSPGRYGPVFILHAPARTVSRVDLLSRRFRSRLIEVFSGYYVLREIDTEFQDADLRPHPGLPSVEQNGQRRSLVQSYYDAIDFSDPVQLRPFLEVVASVLRRLERLARNPQSGSAREDGAELVHELGQCGYEYADGAVRPAATAARLEHAKAIAGIFDSGHLREQIARIERSVDTDPALAIGTAKEMVETVAKTILRERGVEFGASDNLPQLAKKAFKAMRQLPEDIPEGAKGADVIRRMLQQLAAAPQALAELRGLFGTGHGQDGRARGLRARHARLAVGTAATLATYLLETHIENRCGPVAEAE